MRQQKMPRVFVGGRSYAVTQRAGILRAELNGYFGWTNVWADATDQIEAYNTLARRIRQVRSGGQ